MKCLVCCLQKILQKSTVGVLKQVNLIYHLCVRTRACCQNQTLPQCQSVHSNSKRKIVAKADFSSGVYSHFKALQSCEIPETDFEQVMRFVAVWDFLCSCSGQRSAAFSATKSCVSKKAHRASGKDAAALTGNLHLNKFKMLFWFSALSHECCSLQSKTNRKIFD